MAQITNDQQISLFRLRLGIFLLILWWIPVYLAIPSLSDLLGIKGNHHAEEILLISIIVFQSIVGLIGLLLTGKELASTLKQVRYKKLPVSIWRIIWSGQTDIDPSYLKMKRKLSGF